MDLVMAKKPAEPKKIPVDTSILKDEDKKALRAEAAKSIAAEMEQDARDKFYADEMAKLRRGKIPEDRIVRIHIDSAPYVPFFMLDGVQFFNGYTYDGSGGSWTVPVPT